MLRQASQHSVWKGEQVSATSNPSLDQDLDAGQTWHASGEL